MIVFMHLTLQTKNVLSDIHRGTEGGGDGPSPPPFGTFC